MNQSEPELSVVVPLHNEEGNVTLLCDAIRAALDPLRRDYEVLLIDDGSTDRTPALIEALAAADPRVRVLRLDANYGQSAALTAGFQAARGDYVLTMDGDLQNDPADFPRLLQHLQDGGFRVVSGWREKRKGNVALRVIPSRVANRLITWVSGLPSRDNGCSVKVYRAELVKGVLLPNGFHRFLPAVLGVLPDEFAQLPVSDRKRHSGQGHYGLSRFFAVVRDLLVLRFVMRGQAHIWLPVISLLCVAAGFFLLAALQLWARAHHPLAGAWFGCLGGLLMAYGLTARAGLLRWLRTQANPPFRLLSGQALAQARDLSPAHERIGEPAGGVRA